MLVDRVELPKPGDGRVLWDDATITGGDVLPGFTCPVSDFFS